MRPARICRTRLIRFTIQLKFIYSILPVTPSLSDGAGPQPGSICALARLQHITRTSLREVGASLGPGFPLSLPLLNPWVGGDGVGDYVLVRAPLIEHNFDVTEDYRHANESLREARLDE